MSTPAAGIRRRATLPARAAFWIQASVLVVLMAASSAPTPLYPLYQERWGFPPVVLTVIFAAYVLALLIALLTAGSLSDHVGRRPVVLASLGLEVVSMVVFITAGSETSLIMARVLQGLATGAAIGALGAYLIELESSVRRGLGTVLNGAGPALGLAAGALASLRPRVQFPLAVRRSAAWVLPAAVATWSLGGLTLSLGPSIIRSLTGTGSILLTGFIVAALTGTGALATLALGAAPARRALLVGTGALLVGMLATVVALLAGTVALYFAATIIAGIGFGAAFLGVLGTLLPKATPPERAGLLSAIYVVSYLSNSVPAVAAGALAGITGLLPTAAGYCVMVFALALFVLLGLITRRTNSNP
jgi:Major Facilitator Superfamily